MRQQERATASVAARESETLERQIAKLVQALKEGVPASVVRAELVALEQRKVGLASRLVLPAATRLTVDVAELYRSKVADLHTALTDGEDLARASDLVRGS